MNGWPVITTIIWAVVALVAMVIVLNFLGRVLT